jgi:large subunit ribosomal protein L31
MNTALHPKTGAVSYTCSSCGKKYTALSTAQSDVVVEMCSNCHPFYTGEEGVVVDTYSRVDRFKKQTTKADQGQLVKKKKKIELRGSKTKSVSAGEKLTLKDMLKQL